MEIAGAAALRQAQRALELRRDHAAAQRGAFDHVQRAEHLGQVAQRQRGGCGRAHVGQLEAGLRAQPFDIGAGEAAAPARTEPALEALGQRGVDARLPGAQERVEAAQDRAVALDGHRLGQPQDALDAVVLGTGREAQFGEDGLGAQGAVVGQDDGRGT